MILPYILLIILIILFARDFWLQALLPAQARDALNRGDRAKEMALLQKVIKIPGFLPGTAKGSARFRLAAMYMEDGRYEDAAQECRTLLAGRPGRAARVNIGRRLADCLEFMGDTAGALKERYVADKALQSGRETADSCLSRRTELARAQRYPEACAAFHRCLDLMPTPLTRQRGQVMIKLAIAYFDAGVPEKTIEWAERAIEQNLEPRLLTLAHRMAGVGCSNAGRLDGAEKHYRQGLDIAAAAGNKKEVGKDLVQLAHIQELRGKLTEALQTCQKGGEMIDGTDARVLRLVEGECFRHLGRFDEARASMLRAQHAPPFMSPSAEARSQATLCLGLSWIEADAGRVENAWDYLQKATRVFMTDAKMNVSCEGTLAWVLALLGKRADAVQKAQEVEARQPQWTASPRTAQTCCSMPGRAYFIAGEFYRSRACWERYLTLSPDPVFLPMAYWYIGECSLRLDDVERARESFHAAAALDIPTSYQRLAHQRLAEMESVRERQLESVIGCFQDDATWTDYVESLDDVRKRIEQSEETSD